MKTSSARNPLKIVGGLFAAAALAVTGISVFPGASAHAAEVPVQASNEELTYLYGDGSEGPADITGGNVDIP